MTNEMNNKPVHSRLGRRRSVDPDLDETPQHRRLDDLRNVTSKGKSSTDQDDGWTLDKLNIDLTSKRKRVIYGREAEMSVLQDAYVRIRRADGDSDRQQQQRSSELVVVVGGSGTGKSVLVEELRKPVEASNGFFVQGQFDPQNRTQPYTGFLSAFTELCDRIVLAGKDQSLGGEIRSAVGADRDILTNIIPSRSLKEMLGDEGADSDSDTAATTAVTATSSAAAAGVAGTAGTKELIYRLQFAFRRFVRAVCSPSHPLVLFLDNLQWADASSLALIESLLKDAENTSLLLVGAFRDDELDEEHRLSVRLRDIEGAGVAMTRIVIGTLDVEAVSSIVCQALRMDADATRSLTEIVYRKTGGNAYFVVQFLLSIHERRYLHYNFGLMRWLWDEGMIESELVTANVASFMTSQIREFSPEVRFLLQCASCLGCDFNIRMLQLAMASIPMSGSNSQDRTAVSESDLSMLLEEVVAAGLLDKREGGKRLVFVHNQIQAAAFHLIPEEEQNQLQGRIGLALVYYATPEELEEFLFVAVDLCNCGASFLPFVVDGDKKRVKLAELNLRAGQKLLASAAYTSAVKYLSKGISLLSTDPWATHFNLYLTLNHAQLRAQYCVGNFDAVNEIADDMLLQDLGLNDKFDALWFRILSHCSSENYQRGIDHTYEALQQLGVKAFPRTKASPSTLRIDLMKTKHTLNNHTFRSLTNLPTMVDEREIKIVSLLDLLATMTYIVQQDLWALVVFRMVRHTVKFGASKNACTTFAAYGILLCSLFSDFEGGCRFGQIALSLVKSERGRDKVSRVVYMVHGIVNHWARPMHECLPPLQRGYEVGMETGNIQSAMFCLLFYGQYLWYTSQHLSSLEADLMSFIDHMQEYKQLAPKNILLPFLQVVQNLQGRTDSPILLRGESMDHYESLQLAKKGSKNLAQMAIIKSLQVELAYLFNNYEAARDALEEFGELKRAIPSQFQVCRHSFFECLTSIALARQSKQNKSAAAHAMRIKKKIKRWVNAGAVNVLHRYQLIQAEMAALRGKADIAKEKYNLSALTALRHGFLQDASLARERAGIFFLSKNDSYWAQHYFAQAHQGYKDWGCKAKADQIAFMHADLLSQYLSTPFPVSVTRNKRENSMFKSYINPSRRSMVVPRESLLLPGSTGLPKLPTAGPSTKKAGGAAAAEAQHVSQKPRKEVASAGLESRLDSSTPDAAPIQTTRRKPASCEDSDANETKSKLESCWCFFCDRLRFTMGTLIIVAVVNCILCRKASIICPYPSHRWQRQPPPPRRQRRRLKVSAFEIEEFL